MGSQWVLFVPTIVHVCGYNGTLACGWIRAEPLPRAVFIGVD